MHQTRSGCSTWREQATRMPSANCAGSTKRGFCARPCYCVETRIQPRTWRRRPWSKPGNRCDGLKGGASFSPGCVPFCSIDIATNCARGGQFLSQTLWSTKGRELRTAPSQLMIPRLLERPRSTNSKRWCVKASKRCLANSNRSFISDSLRANRSKVSPEPWDAPLGR